MSDRKEYKQKWYQDNKEHLLLRRKEYYKQNKETYKEKTKAYARTMQGRFQKFRNDAKYRGKEWSLTLDEYKSVVENPCYYCAGYFGAVVAGVGLDRMDNSKGYILGNVISCCGTCNSVKGTQFTVEETKTAINAIITLRRSALFFSSLESGS